MENKVGGIYDGFKELGTGKMLVLGFQHTFAMFGATILVPILTGLSISVTLFCAGIGTLLFHLLTKNKVPIFLGSSFAWLAAFGTIAPMIDGQPNVEMLPYCLGGVVCAGGVYCILALLFQIFGAKKVMRLFPPVVTGPIIILLGLILAPSAVSNMSTCYWLAAASIIILIVVNIWGKGMIKILPILIGIIGAYIVALIAHWLGATQVSGAPLFDFSGLAGKAIVGLPQFMLPKFEIGAIVSFIVVALASMIEHIGDIAAIGATCGKNYIADPGLTRTLLGDGLATSLAGCIGGPANTTYSENTGVVALTKVYDPNVMLIAAGFAIILSLSPMLEAIIGTIPTAVIGGISLVLYGMISAVGARTLVENHVDYSNMRNVIVSALILVCGLGFNAYPITIPAGGATLTFGGIAVAAVVGVIVNAVLPGKDYEFNMEEIAA